MAWWQNFAGGGTLKFPLDVELLPGVLSARVSYMEFTFLGQEVSCWCYRSVGLAALGQRELLFILRREADQGEGDFPQAPCEFFRTAASYALRGEFVEEGSVSEFGPAGFLLPQFRGFGYVAPQPIGEWQPPAHSLAIIMLTEEEIECVRIAGLTRAIGMLGMAQLHFPCPLWNSLTRVSAVSAADVTAMRESLMSELPRLSIKSATVLSRDNNLRLRIPRSGASLLHDIEQLEKDIPFIMLCGVDHDADSLLVWNADETQGPVAIKAASSKGEKVGASYVCFVPNQSVDRVLTKEDGFAVSLGEASWREIRAALARGDNFSLTPSEGAAFSLEWFDDPAGIAPDAEAVEKANALGISSCSGGADTSNIPAVTRQIKLLTHEPDMQGRIDPDKLYAYIEHLQEVVAEHFYFVGQQEGFDLILECTLANGAEPSFVVNSRPVIEKEDVDELLDRLSITFAPAVKESSVSFVLELSVWGGSKLEGGAS